MSRPSTANIPFAWETFREYVFPGGVRQLANALRRSWWGRGKRTTEASRRINDTANRRLEEEIRTLSPDDLYERLVYQKGQVRYLLEANRVVFAERLRVEQHLHEQLAQALGLTPAQKGRILEVGCAQGRNLFWLKRNYPGMEPHGADISAEGIRMGERFARQIGLRVEFATLQDHRLPFPDKWFDFSFTKHCLEQCPQTYPRMVQELLRVTRQRVVLLEPIGELAPRNLRGYFSRLHIFYHDYCRGILPHLKQVSRVVRAERLGWGLNPLCETSMVVLEPPS